VTASGVSAAPGRGLNQASLILAVTCLVLAAIGVLLATIGAFLVPQRLPGGLEGLAALLALVGNAAVGAFGGIATGSRIAAFAPGVAWFVTAGVLTSVAPGGDVIIPGKLPADPGVVDVGMAFLLLGVAGVALGVVATTRYTKRRRRPTSKR
jgi:hypothetical protein